MKIINTEETATAEEFTKNPGLHVLSFIHQRGGFCQKSEFPFEWNEDILHGTLEILCRNKMLIRKFNKYELLVPLNSLNRRTSFSAKNTMKSTFTAKRK